MPLCDKPGCGLEMECLPATTFHRQAEIVCHRNDDAHALCAKVAELERRLEEAKTENKRHEIRHKLDQHTINRWVPCPDHRDKTTDGCYVCRNEKLKSERDAALAQVVVLKEALENRIINDEPCWFTPTGYCKIHDRMSPCILTANAAVDNTSATAQQFIDRIRREAVEEALELFLEADLLFMDETPVTREHLREILFKEKS